MKKQVTLVSSVLVLFAAVVYASPCTDRRITFASTFSGAVGACNGDASCVERGHHAYMQCLAVGECSY